MKKHGLVHLHGLFVQIRQDLNTRGDVPGDAYREYDAQDVSPMAVYRSKAAHREAIALLGAGIRRTIAHQRAETQRPGGERPPPVDLDEWDSPTQ